MPDLSKTYLYRMLHIENIAHVLQYGITHSTSIHANPDFVPIGDGNLIAKRNHFMLENGRTLGDYVPFYFATRTPMLYVIQKGYQNTPIEASKIVYCISSVQKIVELQLDFVFTDGHAVDSFSTQYSPLDVDNINTLIDKKAISTKYWSNEQDLDLKRRKEAAFLVLGDIAPVGILGYCVYNQAAKDNLIDLGIEANKIAIRTGFYF